MPTPVAAGGAFKCTNSGTGTFTGGSSRLTVGGAAVLVLGQEASQTFLPLSCTAVAPGTGNPAPCATTQAAVPGGASSKLTIGGTGVLLESATGLTDNAVVPSTWSITAAGQSKLTVSS
jgi:hypothetical protein